MKAKRRHSNIVESESDQEAISDSDDEDEKIIAEATEQKIQAEESESDESEGGKRSVFILFHKSPSPLSSYHAQMRMKVALRKKVATRRSLSRSLILKWGWGGFKNTGIIILMKVNISMYNYLIHTLTSTGG